MNAKTEIALLDQTAISAVFTTQNGVDALLQRLREEAASEVPDLTTKKGRDRIASLAYKVSKAKTLVDDHGKELVAEEKKRLALIDADRKKWRDSCDALRDEIRKPLTDWEQAEADRVKRHQDAIETMRGLTAKAVGQDSAAIAGILAEAEAVALGDHWQEFAAAAGETKDSVVLMLESQLLSRQKYEVEQEELARLRAEAARAREAVERARIAAEQAEARAKAEAEAAKLREQEAERRRIESEERAAREAKEAAERAERDRVAAIEAERRRAEEQARREQKAKDAEEARRLADKEHRRKINRAIMEDLVAEGISEEDAKRIIDAIVSNKVRHVRIAY